MPARPRNAPQRTPPSGRAAAERGGQRRRALDRRPHLRPAAEALQAAAHRGCHRQRRMGLRHTPARRCHAGARDSARADADRHAVAADRHHARGHADHSHRPVLVPGPAAPARPGIAADVVGHDRGRHPPGRAGPHGRAADRLGGTGRAPPGLVHERCRLACARTRRRAGSAGAQRGRGARALLQRERGTHPQSAGRAVGRARVASQHERARQRGAEGDQPRGAGTGRQAERAAAQADDVHRRHQPEPGLSSRTRSPP